ncbi:hypothetical protein QR680_009630 [Steinernema hermaphroditum]|uniref:Uncharacterized protein n=1 Tax=Steinernema hermaphroditum TaxID=289476 RepID=A0AA39IMT6_9BILA|nr:hypothetical protein QR680_009630 [Steinernema hermaphroditum]
MSPAHRMTEDGPIWERVPIEVFWVAGAVVVVSFVIIALGSWLWCRARNSKRWSAEYHVNPKPCTENYCESTFVQGPAVTVANDTCNVTCMDLSNLSVGSVEFARGVSMNSTPMHSNRYNCNRL